MRSPLSPFTSVSTAATNNNNATTSTSSSSSRHHHPISFLAINCNSPRSSGSGGALRSSPRPCRGGGGGGVMGWMMCTPPSSEQQILEQQPLLLLEKQQQPYVWGSIYDVQKSSSRIISKAPSPNSVMDSIMSLSLSQSEEEEEEEEESRNDVEEEDDRYRLPEDVDDSNLEAQLRQQQHQLISDHTFFTPPEIMPPPPFSTTTRQKQQQQQPQPRRCKTTATFQSVRFHPQVSVFEIPHIDDMSREEIDNVYISRDELAHIKRTCWDIVDLLDEGHIFPELPTFSARGLTDLRRGACDHRSKLRCEAYKVVMETQMEYNDNNDDDDDDEAIHVLAERYHHVTVCSQRTAYHMAYWDAQILNGQKELYEV